ncbi:Endonuclease/exonuclease/phosphatase [Corchorus capsularis]|uniref:Endonuclease/exonuclease/phosphatase n=1 Tax=Corchorus capsularis TaxID=210143 RepID=A0A1R3FZR9_COCAP|nr:Endonuclease/exonuclease/phosphatase [Corchorus capsularis]
MIGGDGFIVEDKLENNRVIIHQEVDGISNDEDRPRAEISRLSTGPVNMGSEGINSGHEMDLSLLSSNQERALVCNDNNRPIESKGLNKRKEKKHLMEIFREQWEIRSTLSGTSLSYGDISNSNKVILKEAEAIWEVSSALGVVFEDHRESVIKAIAAQEDRDARVLVEGYDIVFLQCGFGNVYAPNDDNGRSVCFNEIASEMAQFEVLWVFINSLGLIDLPLVVDKFIWGNNWETPSFGRLDRILLADKSVIQFTNIVQKNLPRSLSDHNPVFLCVDKKN